MLILPDKIKAKLVSVLAKEPSVEKAFIFGSRARGDAKDQSDIDLALQGSEIPLSLNTKLRDAAGLYQMDIVKMNELENNDLLINIEREGVVIYSVEEAIVT